jgi:hypothetical protein
MKKLATTLLAAVGVFAVAPWVVWWTALPDPMASHWSGGDRPDSHMPRALLFVLLSGLAVGFVIAALTALHSSRASRGFSAASGVGFAAGVLATVSFTVVYVQRDITSWEEARLSLGWLGAALAVGFVVAAITTVALPVANFEASRRPTVPVARHEALAWAGHAHAGWTLVVAATLMAVGGLMIPTVSVVAGVVMILSGLLMVWFSSTHVVVGRNGVRVRGALAWPTFSIPLARIESAESTLVEPMQWGGWGYRGSLRLSGRAALIVRGGEALRLKLRNTRKGVNVVFTVTVEDSDAAAAVVNGLIRSAPSEDRGRAHR